MKLKEINKNSNIRYKIRKDLNRLNLIKLLDWSAISKTDDKIKTYKLRLFYEYFNEDLRDEVEMRRMENLKFTDQEMLTLSYHLIETLAEMQKENINHGEISSKFIFCDSEGQYKLCEMMGQRTRFPENIIKK